MSGTRYCVTNMLADVRSCTVRGEHLAHCDGHARVWDPQSKRVTILDDACSGCLPRPAEVGWLCYSHLVKFDAALTDAEELIGVMWDEQSNGVRDTNEGGGRGSSSPNWTIPESRLLSSWVVASMRNAGDVLDGDTEVDLTYVDGVRGLAPSTTLRQATDAVRYLVEDLTIGRDELISTPRGAEAALRMTAVVQSAYRKFPLTEAEHRVVGIRCPNCHEARLVWTPPLMHRGDVVIRCDECGNTEPQSWLEQWAAIAQIRPIR